MALHVPKCICMGVQEGPQPNITGMPRQIKRRRKHFGYIPGKTFAE